MAIDAVGRHVQCAVLVPSDEEVVGVPGNVLHFRERLDPIDATCLLAPEALRVLHRARIHFLIFGAIDEGALAPLFRNRNEGVGHERFPMCVARYWRSARHASIPWSPILR